MRNFYLSGIPKRIIQFWHDKTVLPDYYARAIEITRDSNIDCEYLFADDEFIISLLEEHRFYRLLRLYLSNKIPASRSDLARLVLLYVYGGVYMDVSIAFYGSLDKLLKCRVEEVLLLQRDDFGAYKECPSSAHVVNGILVATSKSPFIYKCIHEIVDVLESGAFNHNVLKTTCLILNDVLSVYDNKDAIGKLSFDMLKNNYLNHVRLKGKFNSWRPLQKHGIIDFDKLSSMYFGSSSLK